MIDIALYEPEIPPNTGNVIRLCANTGSRLHLIHPLGFELDDKRLRRAGLDYHEWARVDEHASLQDLLATHDFHRLYAVTTRGSIHYTEVDYRQGDLLLFGPESRGLPETVLASVPAGQRIRIPMVEGVRSINLSNAVAVVVYEAWRQRGFGGGV
ncbi:MAG: tRNA (uridine(34)/cytosine(34)/5-carboxymethylaminomethyluridine(34)-2'-O)-methyltransferase TrmL [Gammaproteobacteria bacterium]|nr:tRNA (uridine(34)/cytosine(34)/5-carboxymethylaminomethyluridine(34)-2'-O)-methyltransferase TrmL [Gammaproteobacteria bacterium]